MTLCLAHVVDRFDVFRPSKLLFTKLDETGSFGPILSEAVRTGKPVSFLSIGQRIPDDLEEASPGRMASRILAGHAKAIPAAA
jgi:flagellar biosynthesis protein FlhF